jgi:hypothetical protein
MSGTMRPSKPGSGLPGGSLAFIVGSLVIAVVVLVVALRGGSQNGATATDYLASAVSSHDAGTAMPPWPVAADPSAAIRAAGLTPLASEGTADHFHAHLDVLVNGSPVQVPADIGIDEANKLISSLHTHDPSGVIHIEAPVAGSAYYLGQLFTEWNVALSSDTLGGLKADGTATTLTAYVDGKPFSGDPATIKLEEHEEIALVYGPAGDSVAIPSTYDFGNL